MDAPRITPEAVNVEAADPAALASFWAGVTGATPHPAGITVHLEPASPDGFAMFFQPLAGDGPDRSVLHLDLTVPWGSREAEVDRLVALGAARQWDVLDELPHVRWTTLADPEGNLLWVAEHPPAG